MSSPRRAFCLMASVERFCQQLLEARSGDPTAGATKIVVNYLNVAPTELVPALDEAVLTPLALEIVYNLIGR